MINLIYGDALEEMQKLIDKGVTVDAVITDPPYGTTANKWDSIINMEEMWKRLKLLRKDNSPIVLFGSEPFSSFLRINNIKEYKYDWVWIKNLKTGNLNARKMPMGGNELISVFYKKPPTYNPQKRARTTEKPHGNTRNSTTSVYGAQKERAVNRADGWINPDTVLNGFKCVHSSQGRLHNNQKPVALMEYLIKTYTNECDTVLDFTCGSGSTGVACRNTNRNFIGIDNGICEKEGQFKDMKWIDVAKWRIEND